jgi:hypothetical protein
MALLVIVAIMTGVIVGFIVAKVTHWVEVLLLGGWGILATVAVYNGDLARFAASVGAFLGMG